MTYTPTAAANQQAMENACNQYNADQLQEQADMAQLQADLMEPVSSDSVTYILQILIDCMNVYGDKAAMDSDSQNIAAAGLNFEASISQELASTGTGGAAESQDLVDNMNDFYTDLYGTDGTNGIMNGIIDPTDQANLESYLNNISTQIAYQVYLDGSAPAGYTPGQTVTPKDLESWNMDDINTALYMFGQTNDSVNGGTINNQFTSCQDSTQSLESLLGTMNQIATTDYQSNVSMVNEIESVAGDYITQTSQELGYFVNKQVTN